MKPSSAMALVSAMPGLSASFFSALVIESFFVAQPMLSITKRTQVKALAIDVFTFSLVVGSVWFPPEHHRQREF
jgi:hypothetical protein